MKCKPYFPQKGSSFSDYENWAIFYITIREYFTI